MEETRQSIQELVDRGRIRWIEAFDPERNLLTQPAKVTIKVLSYNILAKPYAKPEWFPSVPVEHLAYESRAHRILAQIEAADADFVCMQVRIRFPSNFNLFSRSCFSRWIWRGFLVTFSYRHRFDRSWIISTNIGAQS